MFMYREITTARVEAVHPAGDRSGERGAGIVEWLGISALSIGLLVAVFAALETLGLDLVASIRSSLGL